MQKDVFLLNEERKIIENILEFMMASSFSTPFVQPQEAQFEKKIVRQNHNQENVIFFLVSEHTRLFKTFLKYSISNIYGFLNVKNEKNIFD